MSGHAALGRQFQQLAMFHTASELMDPSKVIPGTFRNAASDPEMLKSNWDRTLREAKPIQADIKSHGIKTPVELRDHVDGREAIVDGHHRIAVAHDISPHHLVPVTYFR